MAEYFKKSEFPSIIVTTPISIRRHSDKIYLNSNHEIELPDMLVDPPPNRFAMMHENNISYSSANESGESEIDYREAVAEAIVMNKEHEMSQNHTANMMYATYGLQDWIVNAFHKKFFETGLKNMVIHKNTWMKGARFDLNGFVVNDLGLSENHKLTFTSRTSVVIHDLNNDILVEAVQDGLKVHVQVHAEEQQALRVAEAIDSKYDRMQSTIHWVYGSHGQTAEVPLNFKPARDEFYPFLNEPLEDFFANYLDSDEAVLILIGPPGTGKTTFIKNLLNFGKGDALVTFDPQIMASDSLFARFIDETDIDFLVMEDADAFLKSRADGNQMMHKFLNVSDGLISTRGKKLIFSTNLPSINDIDEALLRPGRCFRVVEFRNLSTEEAEKLNSVMPVNIHGGSNTYSLAELMSSRTVEQKKAVKTSTRTIGFV